MEYGNVEVEFFFPGFFYHFKWKQYFLHYPFNKRTVVWIFTEVTPNREFAFFKVAG